VAEALGAGKGGGRPGLFQGKMPSMDGLDAAMALLGARGPQVMLLIASCASRALIARLVAIRPLQT
jgi:hypothetical protein